MSGQRMDSERQAARIARLEAQLAAARREIEALRVARNAALQLSVWGRPREHRTEGRT